MGRTSTDALSQCQCECVTFRRKKYSTDFMCYIRILAAVESDLYRLNEKINKLTESIDWSSLFEIIWRYIWQTAMASYFSLSFSLHHCSALYPTTTFFSHNSCGKFFWLLPLSHAISFFQTTLTHSLSVLFGCICN